MQSWNWSFLPLDLLISTTGLLAVLFRRSGRASAPSLTLVSLVLTSCSGLMAVAFWALRRDYNWAWWIPNLFLLLYPVPFIVSRLRARPVSAAP